jgi:PAS domain S-box-containing protein
MDERSIIVAASGPAAALLGYARPSELVGQRITRIVPARYHQAHIAGTTLHMVNGRSPLLGQRLTVPVVTATGAEVDVELLVEPQHLTGGRRLFVADLSAESVVGELTSA